MSAAKFVIDRIALTLAGVAPGEAENIARTLEAALAERLGGWRPDVAGVAPLNLGTVKLEHVELPARLNTSALATIVADRLIGVLSRAIERQEKKP
jgi:hypothetical protein